jgi:hypothetical protein
VESWQLVSVREGSRRGKSLANRDHRPEVGAPLALRQRRKVADSAGFGAECR